VIKPQYEDARGFGEGLAAVKMGGKYNHKWGFIDKNGKVIIEPQFDAVPRYNGSNERTSFNNGLSPVKINGKWGFISNPLKSN
jgi:hypothetical protein